DYSSAFRISRLGDSVIVDASVLSNGREYYPANFGCVSSLLESDNKYKGPRWYTQGLPEVFADVVFDGPHATIGGILPQYAWTLSRGGFIPMRTFLKLSVQEEEQGHYFPHLYAAESWYLARQIFVEGKHRSEFNHYLGMLRTGVVEAAAFAASFSLSYEDLDKELVGDMRHSARAYVVDFAEPAAPAGSRSAVALNAAEVQGRLALLSVRCERGPDGPDAVQLAGEALRTDPGNESALRALALAQLERKAYGEALSAAERLPGALASPAAYDDRADVLAGVAAAAGTAVAATEVATLRTRASQDYNAALAAVPDDRRAQNGLERLSAAH
ncbi:MAG: hypothetical protein KGJ68_13930, partial [Gammaproteobacteria bacterium]|nr:hypothetical protein [Gammaproteobacteria bacterium]